MWCAGHGAYRHDLALALQRSKVVCKLVTTDDSFDKEILIRTCLERRRLQEKATKGA